MFKLLLTASVVIYDLYLFHIISLLNPDFKLVNNLVLSSLDKVTTGTYNLQSFIASVALVGALSFTTEGPASTCLCSKLVIMQFYPILILKILHNKLMEYLVLSKNYLNILMV